MPLTYSQRTAFEACISSAISNIPNMLDKWNETSCIKRYRIENINDFLYGQVVGIISNAFHNIIFISEGRVATREEKQEAEDMILAQIPAIRNALAKEIYYHHH